jgi:tRNA G10  N-methylase Trm11
MLLVVPRPDHSLSFIVNKISTMNPNTRICVTNTPLCPIAAFAMCNVAGVKDGSTILDPYAGSCATLLAAAMIAPTCRTVSIEIAHNGLVNRKDIRMDFETRRLPAPVALIQGDSTDSAIRDEARKVIGNEPFDLIITDPPYGIRESKGANNALSPLVQLFRSLTNDRDAGKPLLKVGGRLVAFVPCHEEEELIDCLPTNAQTLEAGLNLELMCEQPLNDKLSCWLVAYSCTR